MDEEKRTYTEEEYDKLEKNLYIANRRANKSEAMAAEIGEKYNTLYGNIFKTGTRENIGALAGEIADMNYNDFTKGDEYKDLAKRYSDQGKLAMDDTIGQVSARTGGLASSYAVGAGNQAYNGYMQKLEDAARSLYDSERSEKKDNLSIAQGIYAQDYQEKRDEVADDQWKKNFLEQSGVNSHNAIMDYLNRADANNAVDKSEAQNKLVTYLAGGMTPTEISQQYPDLMETAGWDTAYLTAYQAAMPSNSEDDFTQYLFTGTYDGDNPIFQYGEGGSTIALGIGINPYTRTKNPDIEYGAWSNGYQPDNVGGKKLTKADYDGELYVNGVKQNVWETENGQWYYWDGTQNKYIETSKDDLEKKAREGGK